MATATVVVEAQCPAGRKRKALCAAVSVVAPVTAEAPPKVRKLKRARAVSTSPPAQPGSSGERSLFLQDFRVQHPSPLTEVERIHMRQLCTRRNLPDHYYIAALTLWMRAKRFYTEAQYKNGLLIALHLALKWDSLDAAYYGTTLTLAGDDWCDREGQLTNAVLIEHELTMCSRLDWQFQYGPTICEVVEGQFRRV